MVKGATPNVLCSIKNEAGIFDDDVNFSEQKAFAHHLLEARKSNTSFMVDKPELAERWNTITPKQFSNNIDDKEKIDKHDIFWNELSKIKLKGKNKTNYILQTICENCSDIDKIDANSLAIMYQDELNEDIMIGINIDSDDINRHGIIQIEDIDENEEGGEEWQDSESPN